jgi:polar amino acid transport system substrate-binding protein
MLRATHRLPVVLTLAVATLAAASGCGGSKKSSASATPAKVAKQAKIAGEVPAAIRRKGTLTVAADATYPPNESLAANGHTVIGMDPDLAVALAKVMGLRARVVNATFDSIIPGLAAHKYDLGMSSFGDTKARQKTVDFVTYFKAGTSFYVKATGGPTINTLADLCGHKVAVEKGTTQQADTTAQAKKCRARGRPADQVLVFPDQNGVNLALSSGRAEVAMADSPVATYQVRKSNGQFKLTGKSYAVVPYGIAIPKRSGLDKPVRDAVRTLISNGTYMSTLKKWGLQAGAISNPKINGAVS